MVTTHTTHFQNILYWFPQSPSIYFYDGYPTTYIPNEWKVYKWTCLYKYVHVREQPCIQICFLAVVVCVSFHSTDALIFNWYNMMWYLWTSYFISVFSKPPHHLIYTTNKLNKLFNWNSSPFCGTTKISHTSHHTYTFIVARSRFNSFYFFCYFLSKKNYLI